jgi:hypothetical protein
MLQYYIVVISSDFFISVYDIVTYCHEGEDKRMGFGLEARRLEHLRLQFQCGGLASFHDYSLQPSTIAITQLLYTVHYNTH